MFYKQNYEKVVLMDTVILYSFENSGFVVGNFFVYCFI